LHPNQRSQKKIQQNREESYRKETQAAMTDKQKSDYLNSDPYANLSLPPAVIYDPNAPPPLPKLKGRDRWLCIYGPMTNEMMAGDSSPSDSSDTAPGTGGAEPTQVVRTYKNGNQRGIGPKMGVDEDAGAKADAYTLFGNYGANAGACFLNSF